MTVSDISGRLLGHVVVAHDASFLVSTVGGNVELSEDALFSVEWMSASLVCSSAGLQRYVVPTL